MYTKFYINLLFSILCSQLLAAQAINNALSATIIGSGAPNYSTARASASVLISNGTTKILVDMGNGTQANLNKLGIDDKNLNALLITHHHLDHNEELAPLFIHALLGRNSFSIYGPPNTENFISSYLKLYEEDINYRLSKSNRTLNSRSNSFVVKDLMGNDSLNVNGIKITTLKVPHTIYTIAYRFEYEGTSIVVTGDLTYTKDLAAFANNADFLIIDAGGMLFKGGNNPYKSGKIGQRNTKVEAAHVNLQESSLMAKEAQIKTLVYTHFIAGEVDELESLKVINQNFSGRVIFAKDLMKL
jgi:ribonuclease BN (tRNA processing enzyme)